MELLQLYVKLQKKPTKKQQQPITGKKTSQKKTTGLKNKYSVNVLKIFLFVYCVFRLSKLTFGK